MPSEAAQQIIAQVTGSAPPPQGLGGGAVNTGPSTNADGAPAPVETRSKQQAFAEEFELDDNQFITGNNGSATPVAPRVGTPEPVKPQPAPVPPKHSPRTLRLASHFGFTAEEVDSLSPEQLVREIQAAQVEANEVARLGQMRQVPIPQEPEPEERLDLTGITYKDANGHDVQATEEDLHPVYATLLKRQQKANRLLEAKLAEADRREVTRRHETALQTFDRVCNEFEGTLGKAKPQQGSPEWHRRAMLWNHLAAAEKGGKQLDMESDTRAAVALLMPGTSAAPAPAPKDPPLPISSRAEQLQNTQARERDPLTGQFVPRITEEQWNGSGLHKPTSRSTPVPSGDEAAVRSVAEKMRARGFETSEQLPDDEANLPD